MTKNRTNTLPREQDAPSSPEDDRSAMGWGAAQGWAQSYSNGGMSNSGFSVNRNRVKNQGNPEFGTPPMRMCQPSSHNELHPEVCELSSY